MNVIRYRTWSVRYHRRAVATGTGCLILAVAAALTAIGTGEYPIDPIQAIRATTGTADPVDDFIMNEVWLPRIVTGLLSGAALATAGAIFQSLTRNPLGSPDILGFTQGAATGALVVIVVIGGGSATLATGAMIGGLATGVAIYAIAWRQGVHGYQLILVGIGIYAMLTGVNGYLLTRAELTDASRAVLWLTGSLDGRTWDNAIPLALAMAVLIPIVLACSRPLHMLEMGDEAARSLGVPAERTRLALLAAGILLASFAAAATGPVAFVALTAPQVARRITRAPGPNLLPALCTGAAMMIAADLAAQRMLPDRQLPVGVVTGVLGGGYLIWMLIAERRAGRL